jgi:hypothetical protein
MAMNNNRMFSVKKEQSIRNQPFKNHAPCLFDMEKIICRMR